MVGEDVRQVESEIDPWYPRDACLAGKARCAATAPDDDLAGRTGTDAHLMAAHAAMFQLEDGLKTSIANEHLMATGAYQALKWAMEFAGDDGLY